MQFAAASNPPRALPEDVQLRHLCMGWHAHSAMDQGTGGAEAAAQTRHARKPTRAANLIQTRDILKTAKLRDAPGEQHSMLGPLATSGFDRAATGSRGSSSKSAIDVAL
jgi:hypothetical protein